MGTNRGRVFLRENLSGWDYKEGIVERKFTAKRLLSVDEAAKYLGVSPRTIYNAVMIGVKIVAKILTFG